MLKYLIVALVASPLLYAQVSEPICSIDDHLNGSVKLNTLSNEAIKAACAQFEEDNKCEEVVEPVQKFNAEDLANRLIAKDSIGQKLIPKLTAAALAEDKSLNAKEIETKIKAKIVKFVKAHQCIPVLGDANTTLDYDEFGGKVKYRDNNDKIKKQADLKKVSTDAASLQNFKRHQTEKNQQTFYDFLGKDTPEAADGSVSTRFCSEKVVLRQPTKTIHPNPKCVGSVSKYFVNNKAVLREESEKERLEAQKEMSRCVDDNKAAGYVVKTVVVKSSANQLRNTSTLEEIKQGEGFCGYDFAGLSAARNAYAVKNILPGLVTLDAKTQIITDSSGSNGNGSSGPCPYGADGKLLPQYAGANKNQLDDYKSTEIIVEFEPTTVLQNERKNDASGTIRLGSPCEGFKIKCEGSY